MRINSTVNETVPRKSVGMYYLLAVFLAVITFFILVIIGKVGRYFLVIVFGHYYIALVLVAIYILIKLRARKKRRKYENRRFEV
jgi:hypothetical protein